MDWNKLTTHLSSPRVTRYLNESGNDHVKAARNYRVNVVLSEALFPVLNSVEIATRNAIHAKLAEAYGRQDWWMALQESAGNHVAKGPFFVANSKILAAKQSLKRRDEPTVPDKIVCELTFGFWTSLFNTGVSELTWTPGRLHLIFPNCPKNLRKRNQISARLNSIREIRNRVFHHEQVLWLRGKSIEDHHQDCMTILDWIDPELSEWVRGFDRFPELYAEYKSCPPPYVLDFA